MTQTVYPITPIGKPRMTQRDKWKKRPAVLRYHAFKDEVRLRGLTLPVSGAHVTFILPMPASWSKYKRSAMDGEPHQQKPDVDNMLKSVLDAVFESDADVHDVRISKRWGRQGAIVIASLPESA